MNKGDKAMDKKLGVMGLPVDFIPSDMQKAISTTDRSKGHSRFSKGHMRKIFFNFGPKKGQSELVDPRADYYKISVVDDEKVIGEHIYRIDGETAEYVQYIAIGEEIVAEDN
jgi:hypothetical protein